MPEVNRITLANGLRVVHSHVPVTAMAAVNVLYATGSRDEDAGLTGIAHLFEHLMFGGSANVADYSRAMEDAGGYDNAWTDTDHTNFYNVLPAVNIETAFYLESDRMLAPSLTARTLEVQQAVVTEEFKQQCLNRPYGDLGHALRKALYGDSHPYGWPVIGKTPDHVAAATLDDVRRYFYSHYGPDNAVLSVAGNVDFDTVRRLAHRWFGDIPRRNIERRVPAPPRRLAAPVTVEVSGAVPVTTVTMAWLMAPYATRDYCTADLITDLLAADRAGRFYRHLLAGTDLFTEVDASISGSELEGFLMVNFKSRDESAEGIERCRKAVMEVLGGLYGDEPPTQAELERVKTRYEASDTFAMMSYVTKAQALARDEMAGLMPGESVERYRAVTAADVSRVARALFADSCPAVVIYRPA